MPMLEYVFGSLLVTYKSVSSSKVVIQGGNAMKKLISIHTAAETLGISAWTMRRLVKQGRIHCVRVSKRVLIPSDEVERILQEGCKRLDPASSRNSAATTMSRPPMRHSDKQHRKGAAQ
jgi:excisionase family DNA binding protein